uniref:Secreted protein n=1 Tax=Utricularia reniformis TaxID=192314 RepID=A0A1Y0B3Y5_9LAMI|nr:hypothetical protein AEK19_MT2006 [Utricularia reniformis]ART32166.1 hypothetical protein AEK19_MT2006 [Utricularia reniformis]
MLLFPRLVKLFIWFWRSCLQMTPGFGTLAKITHCGEPILRIEIIEKTIDQLIRHRCTYFNTRTVGLFDRSTFLASPVSTFFSLHTYFTLKFR